VAHIIVVGNEKGGAGKSTVSMHVATALVRMGHKVGTLDLDLRQKSLARYISNRREYLADQGLDLPTPTYADLPEVSQDKLGPGATIFDHRLSDAVARLGPATHFILIECSRSASPPVSSSHLAHPPLLTQSRHPRHLVPAFHTTPGNAV